MLQDQIKDQLTCMERSEKNANFKQFHIKKAFLLILKAFNVYLVNDKKCVKFKIFN